MLTGTPNYLEPYQQLPGKLDGLAGAGVTSRADALPQLAQARLQELGETVQLASSGDKGSALAIIDSGTGKRLMDEIRAETARLVQIQQGKVNAALHRSETYSTRIYLSLVALPIQDAIESAGGTLVGPCYTFAEALAAVRNESFDAAVLDVDLSDDDVFPVADELNAGASLSRSTPHTPDATKSRRASAMSRCAASRCEWKTSSPCWRVSPERDRQTEFRCPAEKTAFVS